MSTVAREGFYIFGHALLVLSHGDDSAREIILVRVKLLKAVRGWLWSMPIPDRQCAAPLWPLQSISFIVRFPPKKKFYMVD